MFLGLAWWLLTGEPAPSLPLAVFFELFWLDLIPSGGYLPPMAAYPYLLLLGLCASFGWQEAGLLAVPLAASLPLAYVVPFYEARLRKRDSIESQVLVRTLEEEEKADRREPGAGGIVFKSSLRFLGLGLICFIIPYTGLLAVSRIPLLRQYAVIHFPYVNWPILCTVAAMGALLSLRIRKVYLAFALCMAALFFAKII